MSSEQQEMLANEYWFPFHPEEISDLSTVQLGPLYWKISQTPKELEMDFVYLIQLLNALDIQGSIYLHGFRSEEQSSVIGSVSQNGEAVGFKYALSQKNKKRKVKPGGKLHEVSIDQQKVKREASDNNLNFAQLYQEEFIEALFELKKEEFYRVGPAELYFPIYFIFFVVLFTLPEVFSTDENRNIAFNIFLNWVSANISTFVAERSSKKTLKIEAKIPNSIQIPLKALYLPNWVTFVEISHQQQKIRKSSRPLIRFRQRE